MFKVNNEDTRTTPVALLLTLNIFRTFFSVFIVNFEHVVANWPDPHKHQGWRDLQK